MKLAPTDDEVGSDYINASWINASAPIYQNAHCIKIICSLIKNRAIRETRPTLLHKVHAHYFSQGSYVFTTITSFVCNKHCCCIVYLCGYMHAHTINTLHMYY